ncbi:hypothetical protein [Rhizobium hidalgonense]|uniref:hypothetical protein n=1 Tax=Rhizobium hidalgonense TaxID=1538159 RepID=UPI001105C6F3|nr:hypothetical protein [Rhizobium hidalgonense]QKK24650.1 hypothetical protein FFM81_015455 [Rhizobium hidalgonense]
MPRNPSTGVYSKPAGTTPSVGQIIDPAPWNQLTTDLGNEITNSLPRDGSAPMVAPLKLATGTAGAPGIGFSSTPQTGLYLKGGGLLGFTQNGVDISFARASVYAAKSGDYTALAVDDDAVLRFTAVATLSLTAAATLGANWSITVIADGGDVTIDPNGAETIDGAATLVVPNGYSVFFVCSGTAFFTDKVLTRLQAVAASAEPGHLYGLTLSNNVADATNDIDIAIGSAASDATSPVMITLASALTKRLDANWSVGPNQGGLDTGSIANTTYHVWLIARSDTGVVDALFSTSAISPTMPTNYDRKRRIGAFKRESGAIWAFKQDGDFFELVAPTTDTTTITTSSALRTLRVPVGFPLRANITVVIGNTAGAMSSANHWNPALGATLPSSQNGFVQTFVNTPVSQAASEIMDISTNASAQIYNQATGPLLTSYSITTLAYWDRRGRF